MKKRLAGTLPIPVERALGELGADIRNARTRRRIPTALLAEHVGLTRGTLVRIEHGDPGTSMGAYASVLFVLGLIDHLARLAKPGHDRSG